MSRTRKPRKPSLFRLTVTQRFRRSWTLWRLNRADRKQARETKRLVLMQQQLDSQLLQLKELEQLQQLLQHRLAEMEESRLFRQIPSLWESPPLELTQREQLDQLLGLDQPE